MVVVAIVLDVFGCVEAVGGDNFHQGGERAADGLLSCVYNSLKPLPVSHGAAGWNVQKFTV